MKACLYYYTKMKENKKNTIILFKYGGNAMSNDALKEKVLKNICMLKDKGYDVVITHGGGPFIKQALEEAKIESEFIDGHRKTTAKAFEYVEMTLKGKVNSKLVSIINSLGYKAVGLSGQDGKVVTARKRLHEREVEGKKEQVDLGQVGDVDTVDPTLLKLLLQSGFIPVISCTAADENGAGFNINGDMFAGHIAGALKADQYVVLTDVDGLMKDKDRPETLMHEIQLANLEKLVEDGIIQGGMIPKIESCEIAIQNGAKSARIINGTQPEKIPIITENQNIGTIITK